MVKEVDRERGIASGDQNGDVGVVDPAPQSLRLRFPANPVINRATGKEGHGRERENPQSDPPLEPIGGGYEDQAGNQAHGGHDQVDDASEFWLFRRNLGAHSTRVDPRGPRHARTLIFGDFRPVPRGSGVKAPF